jgi:hypothetical protein
MEGIGGKGGAVPPRQNYTYVFRPSIWGLSISYYLDTFFLDDYDRALDT